jgi:predicted ATPase
VHALYRQALYDRLAPSRRARLHRRIGERLEALHPRLTNEVLHELAYHFEAAADWRRAVGYLRLEADIARRRFAHSQADSLLQRAEQLACRLPAAAQHDLIECQVRDLVDVA